MAVYPSYPILLASTQDEEAAGIQDDFSQPGGQHSRIFHSQSYYRFSLIHNLTLAEWNTLFATYTAGPRDEYTLTYHIESPAVTYAVKFTDVPEIIRNLGGDRFDVRVPLRGVKGAVIAVTDNVVNSGINVVNSGIQVVHTP